MFPLTASLEVILLGLQFHCSAARGGEFSSCAVASAIQFFLFVSSVTILIRNFHPSTCGSVNLQNQTLGRNLVKEIFYDFDFQIWRDGVLVKGTISDVANVSSWLSTEMQGHITAKSNRAGVWLSANVTRLTAITSFLIVWWRIMSNLTGRINVIMDDTGTSQSFTDAKLFIFQL